MPRKRSKTDDTIDHQAEHHPTSEGPVTTAAVIDHPNDVAQAFADAGIRSGADLEQPTTEHNGHADAPKPRPVRETFTSTAAGVRAVEDKRFALPRVGVDFDDSARATDQEKAELKEAGFRYDVRDKGYTAIANPETRAARDTLAQSFTERRLAEQKAEPGEGQSR